MTEVGETDVLNLEVFVNARPFSELDDDWVGNGELAESPLIGP